MYTLSEGQILKKSEPLQFAERGIYFLIKDDRVVYVGQSRSNMLQRIAQHTHDKDFDAVAVHAVPERYGLTDLDELEAAYIYELTPPYNAIMPPNSRYLRKESLKTRLGLTGHQLNRLLRKAQSVPRMDLYYDASELEKFL